jgi:hypothetical protein
LDGKIPGNARESSMEFGEINKVSGEEITTGQRSLVKPRKQ